ncbi:BON domain-containing protein [Noviherbaspirillum malthae]|uniref:BON domain-containing protein n=1 Tax=Noviherbaspirillum malthae TaxID=1260987 RepID=UPI002B272CF3|nr:BON domain-containing protein [Noviherbaspirillum malthae]
MMKSDKQLRDDVMDELEWEPAVDAGDIGVEVKDGVVTLFGHLSSFAEKVAAERAVQRVSGVKGLAVELDVRLPTQEARSDTELAHAAKSVLEMDTFVPKDAIDIVVEDGRVKLSGLVTAEFQRRAAERDVRNLRGVKDVINNVTVRPIVLSHDVKSRIESALQRRAHAETKAITVSVEGDEITLTGTVPTWQERNAIVHAAWNAPGVGRVVNHIAIRT